jgi:hypothetical protein
MNPRDKEREFGAMLRRGLASSAAATESECLEADLLAAYFERSLSAEEIRACDAHVANCAHCRSQLAAMARAEPEGAEDGARRKSWIWDWRLLVPVTAALTALAVWVGVRHESPMRTAMPAASPTASIVAQNEAPAVPPPPASAAPRGMTDLVQVSPEPARSKDKKAIAAAPMRSSGANSSLGGASGGVAGGAAPVAHAAAQPPAPAPPQQNADRITERKMEARNAQAGVVGGVAGGVAGGVVKAQGADQSAANAPTVSMQSQAAAPSSTVVVVEPGPAPSQPTSAPQGKAGGGGAGGGYAPKAAAPGMGGLAKERGAANTNARAAEMAPPSVRAQAVTSRYQPDDSKPIVIPAPDGSTIWRVADKDEIQFSNDVGATWQSQLAEPDLILTAGSAPKANVCWMVGRGGIVLRTADGENWQRVKSPTPLDLVAVTAQDADVASITAKDGSVFTTKDGGANWTSVAAAH